MSGIDRRDYLKRWLGGLIGLASGAAYLIAHRSAGKLPGRMARALSLNQLDDTEPEKILDHFYNASIGEYSYYYQEFWPIFGEKERLERLDYICSKYALDHRYQGPQRHRLVSLPTLARIHALGALPSGETIELREAIIETHRVLLDHEPRASRAGVESVWQTMVGALIRNRHNWLEFNSGAGLLAEAEKVCKRWLTEEPMLFSGSIAAWQFLLTYLRALEDRGDRAGAREVQNTLSRILEHGERVRPAEMPWLEALSKLYEGRWSYDRMLPQMSELFLGAVNLENKVSGEFLYGLNVRMEADFRNYLVTEGKLNSPVAKRDFSIYSNSVTWAAVIDYGITRPDWLMAKSLAERLHLPASAGRDSYVEERFQALRTTAEPDEAKQRGAVEAAELRALYQFETYPFRRTDAETVFEQNARRRAVNPFDDIGRATPGQLGQLFSAEAEAHLKHVARRSDLSIDPSVLREEIDRAISVDVIRAHQSCFERLRDELAHRERTMELSRRFDGGAVEEFQATGTGDMEKSEDDTAVDLGRKKTRRSWRSKELLALVFESEKDIDDAIGAFFDDPDLADVDWQLLHPRVISIPRDSAVSVIRERLRCRIERFADPESMAPSEWAKIRSRRFLRSGRHA